MVTKRARARKTADNSETATATDPGDLDALVESHGYRAGAGRDRCHKRNDQHSQCLLERGHGVKSADGEPTPHVFRGTDGKLASAY